MSYATRAIHPDTFSARDECRNACYEEAGKIVELVEHAAANAGPGGQNCVHVSALIRELLGDYGNLKFFDFDAIHLINVAKKNTGRHHVAAIGLKEEYGGGATTTHKDNNGKETTYRLWDVFIDLTNWNVDPGWPWDIHLLETGNDGYLHDQHPSWKGGKQEANHPFGPSTPQKDHWYDLPGRDRYKTPGKYPLKKYRP